MKKGYENYDLCKKCGGKCCKRLPGCCFPEDFEDDEDKILEALKTGDYAIDWWEAEEPLFFIRPATKQGKAKNCLFDPTWGGECIFLDQINGCTLPYGRRPTGCRLLEPKENGGCIAHHSGKKDAGLAWRKYRKMFERLETKKEGMLE